MLTNSGSLRIITWHALSANPAPKVEKGNVGHPLWVKRRGEMGEETEMLQKKYLLEEPNNG